MIKAPIICGVEVLEVKGMMDAQDFVLKPQTV
jgi:hypothetical protein